MDFKKIYLIDSYIYLKWVSALGNTWESWIDPEDLPRFIMAVVKQTEIERQQANLRQYHAVAGE